MRIVVLLLLTCSVVKADELTPSDLLPLAIGNTWTYRVSGQEERFVVRVAGIEKIGEQATYKLEAALRERVVASEHLLVNNEGIYRLRVDKDDVVPPLCIGKVPTMKKQTWRSNFRLGLRYSAATYTMTNEEVISVPAGNKLKTVRIDVDTTDSSGRVRSSYWFAPKIGLVKQTLDEAKRLTTLELEKYDLK